MTKHIRHLLPGLLLCLVIVAITAYLIVSQPDDQIEGSAKADALFINGEIITINPAQPFAEAVAIKDDKILAVGDRAAMNRLIGPDTQIIDLNHRALMPGFIEPHTHPVASAILADLIDVSGFSNPTPEHVFQRLKDAVDQSAPGEWILAFGLDPVLTRGLTPPNRYTLDAIAPDNPVFILSQVMHTAYANSLALSQSGLNARSPDPEGGHFERDEQGKLTGIVHEAAVGAINYRGDLSLLQKIKQALAARQALIDQYDRYASAGYTTIGIPGPVPLFTGYLTLLEHIASRNDSPVRSYTYPLAGEIERTDYYPGYNNGRYTVLGVKIYLDGSPWTGAMATAEPYLHNEFTANIIKMPDNNRGLLKQTPESLYQLVDKYHNRGWQLAFHSHGERAQQLALDTLEQVQQASLIKNRRHRLEHLGLITEQGLSRAAKLGVTPSFFIDHIYYFGPAIENLLLGKDRAQRFMPLAWANEHHQRVSIHTDNPATPLNPMRALRTAVTRIPQHAQLPLNTRQQMSVNNALEAITIDAAWQLHADNELGSIEAGKQADFTLLSANPHKVIPEQWMSITPLATWVAGKQVSGNLIPPKNITHKISDR